MLLSRLILPILGLAALASCATAPAPSLTPEDLTGSSWRVYGLNGGSVHTFHVTISFEEGGEAVGRASCNDYRFAYGLSGNGIAFANTVALTTDRICDLDSIRIEENFLATLGEVDRAAFLPSGALVLYAAPIGRIVARPV